MINQALKDLQNAKKDRKDWLEIVRILDEVRTTKAWQQDYETVSAWLADVAEASGYSESILRRMLAAARFLEDIKSDIPGYQALVAGSAGLPFSTIEILKRIHSLSISKALELFPLVAKGEVSHRQVLQARSSLSNVQRFSSPITRKAPQKTIAMSKGARARPDLEFSHQVAEMVADQLGDFCGDTSARFYFQQYQFEYSRTDAIALKLNGLSVEWIDGFEFRYLPEHFIRPKKLQLISAIALSASFFRKYWLFMPRLGDLGAELVEDFKRLGLINVGVVEVDEGYKVLSEPVVAEGLNRQIIAATTVLSQGIPDLSAYA